MIKKPTICIFGNSHVSMFTGHDSIIGENSVVISETDSFQYRLQRIGPSTAFNFFWNANYYPNIISILDREASFKDKYIGLIVGEIDCRWHLGYNSNTCGRPIDECIEECVDRFFMCYIDLKKRGYKCIVFSVHPASTQGHREIADGPFYGEYKNRNRITEAFNNLLRQKCKIHKIPYCEYYSDLMHDDYEPKMEYFMDTLHLKGSRVLQIVESKLKGCLN
jgi:hypothetical protein